MWVHDLVRVVWVPWGELTEVCTNDRVVLHTRDWSARVTAVQRANAAAMTGARARVDRVREHLLPRADRLGSGRRVPRDPSDQPDGGLHASPRPRCLH